MKSDILGNEVRIGDEVLFMQVNYRQIMKGTIKTMAQCSALITHAPTNTCRTESRQCYSQMVSLSALERSRRPAPENKALTLEELRQMDGEPVWCDWINAWAFVNIGGAREFIFTYRDGSQNTFGELAGFCGKYGKKWAAYRTKPEAPHET